MSAVVVLLVLVAVIAGLVIGVLVAVVKRKDAEISRLRRRIWRIHLDELTKSR